MTFSFRPTTCLNNNTRTLSPSSTLKQLLLVSQQCLPNNDDVTCNCKFFQIHQNGTVTDPFHRLPKPNLKTSSFPNQKTLPPESSYQWSDPNPNPKVTKSYRSFLHPRPRFLHAISFRRSVPLKSLKTLRLLSSRSTMVSSQLAQSQVVMMIRGSRWNGSQPTHPDPDPTRGWLPMAISTTFSSLVRDTRKS